MAFVRGVQVTQQHGRTDATSIPAAARVLIFIASEKGTIIGIIDPVIHP